MPDSETVILLNERLDRLALVLDEIMPNCANLVRDTLELLKEQEETKTIICPKCGDEIEIKWSLLIKPDMEAIAKRDAFPSDKNGKKLNDAHD